MRTPFFLFTVALFFTLQSVAQHHNVVQLPNGWRLSPAGKFLPLGDLPLNLALSPSKNLMAVTNNGQSIQSLQLIDVKKETITQQVVVPKSWYGLAFLDEKTLYASGGNDNWILEYRVATNHLQLNDSIKLGEKWPAKISPAGIAIDRSKKILYTVTKDNNSLYAINLKTKKIMQQTALGSEAYTCLLSPDNKMLYISAWGFEKVLVFDTQKKLLVDSIPVGAHPNEMVLTKNGRYLFVANAADNSVSVIDVKQKKVIETLNTALYANAPTGSTTNGLALSENEKTVYIANADNNCLAVFDVSHVGRSVSKGFIPTGWYPTNVKVIGKKIFVANGKGFSSLANPDGPNPVAPEQNVSYQQGDTVKKEVQYIGGLFKGTLSIVTEPSTLR